MSADRKGLLDLLERYLERHPEDRVRVDHVRQFVRVHEDCFERSCLEGHITGSAFIVSPDHRRFLLLRHRKLGRWLQPGGHADGEADVRAVALREAREESGLAELEVLRPDGTSLPIDVDVHLIPEREGEPAHLHHDIRFLVVARRETLARTSDEANELRWFELERLEEAVDEESLLRLGRRARELLAKSL